MERNRHLVDFVHRHSKFQCKRLSTEQVGYTLIFSQNILITITTEI